MYGTKAATGSIFLMKASPTRASSCKTGNLRGSLFESVKTRVHREQPDRLRPRVSGVPTTFLSVSTQEPLKLGIAHGDFLHTKHMLCLSMCCSPRGFADLDPAYRLPSKNLLTEDVGVWAPAQYEKTPGTIYTHQGRSVPDMCSTTDLTALSLKKS